MNSLTKREIQPGYKFGQRLSESEGFTISRTKRDHMECNEVTRDVGMAN